MIGSGKGSLYRIACIILFLVLVTLSSAKADTAGNRSIRYSFLSGNRNYLKADFQVTGAINRTWKVLTDYKNQNRFMPIIENTRILSELGDVTMIETNLKWGPFRSKTRSRVRAVRKNLYICWEQVDGPFRVNSGSYRLYKISRKRTRIVYTVTVDHPLIPSGVQQALLKKSIPTLQESLEKELRQ